MNHAKRTKEPLNKLKKLFSPSSLAATLATGLLLSSAVVAVAECTSAAAWFDGNFPNHPCQTGQFTCSGTDPLSLRTVFWCCNDGQMCGQVTGNPNKPPDAYGFCCP